MYTDKTINCKDCKEDFVFSASDQEFFDKKGFKNEPQRCKECRDAIKKRMADKRSKDSGRPKRPEFTVVCAKCNATTTVPFEPTGNKPVLCRDCFQATKRR